jgi:hypothetical protein
MDGISDDAAIDRFTTDTTLSVAQRMIQAFFKATGVFHEKCRQLV